MPNPGRMGLGAVLVAPDGERHTLSRLAPGTGCNNEAELRALIAALDEARAHGATAVRIHTDSGTVVAHLGPAAPAPIAHLADAFADARTRLAAFAPADLRWIPCHRNAEADALARAALGLPPRSVAVARKRRR
ncbi:reverse transcriptase-like protein [Xylophilus ampelinus]|uniref:Ribonuclease HI n=2 Tax=Xylophilus ampelinus TaxID=54067 RepID=A0A318SIE8_9BURK|nr:reverse transcriptase-like protein [Xylophilus ampelinus]PYE78582.1 ribonuclease HI [Xylophilus ampelinus]